jgi:serine/threonine-protein kinase
MGKKCPECQFENLDESRFCSKCATSLLSPEEISASPTKTLETPITGLTRSSTFAQRYEVIEELDKGGMGKIYRVFDNKIEQEVALKLLRPEIAADSDTITRFKNELKFARNIAHRNVCRMFDLGVEGNAYYITMEYIQGENLKSSVRRMERLTVKKAISIAKQVCEGLAEAHRLGVVHRDLKPGNIMIDSEGNARILDFGIARSLRSKRMTGAGVMIGTPEFMSPEQVDGEEADQRSDIYSLGVILYEMVTGDVPFKGDTPISVAVKHKLEMPPDPKKINPLIPEDLNHVIMRCLDKDKENRYQNVDELFSELVRIEKGIPILEIAKPKKKRKLEKRDRIQRNKTLIRGAVIGSIFIVLLIVFLLWFGKNYTGQFRIKKPINSMAVLPLKNLTEKTELDSFADRMTEALIDELAKTGTFRRIPPSTSVMVYKTAPKRITEISRELDVEAVIEWTMVLDKNQLLISLKLIEGRKEQTVWNNIYAIDMQDSLSMGVVRAPAGTSELADTIVKDIIAKITDKDMSL